MFGKSVVYVGNIQPYVSVAGQILGRLKQLLQEDDMDSAQTIIQIFVDIAHDEPKFFAACINDLCPVMEKVGMSDSVDEDTRQLALELLLTIVEKHPPLVRKNQMFVETVIKLGLQLMLVLEDIDQPEWNSEYDHNVDDSPCFDAGQVSLCRLAEEISTKKFLPILLPKIEQLLSNNNWVCKHAGLVAIAQTCELISGAGVNKDELFERCASFIKDPNYRVRYATVHCLGIMCTDFGKKFVNKWHNHILNVFMSAMDDKVNPRQQAHAAICVVNLAERLSTKMLRPNLEKLLKKLFDVLNTPNAPKFVQENALSA